MMAEKQLPLKTSARPRRSLGFMVCSSITFFMGFLHAISQVCALNQAQFPGARAFARFNVRNEKTLEVHGPVPSRTFKRRERRAPQTRRRDASAPSSF